MAVAQVTIDYTKALNDKLSNIDEHGSATFDYSGGRSYDRIFIVRHEYRRKLTSSSVHAFVDRKTGGLIKSATWKAPQKNADGSLSVRYDLSTPEGFAKAIDAADFSGWYLLDK